MKQFVLLAISIIVSAYGCGSSTESNRTQGSGIQHPAKEKRTVEEREYDIDQYLPKQESSDASKKSKTSISTSIESEEEGAQLVDWAVSSKNVVLCTFAGNVIPLRSERQFIHLYEEDGTEIPFDELVFTRYDLNDRNFLAISVPIQYRIARVEQKL